MYRQSLFVSIMVLLVLHLYFRQLPCALMKARYSSWKGGLVTCWEATSRREILGSDLDSDHECHLGHFTQAEPTYSARSNAIMNQESK